MKGFAPFAGQGVQVLRFSGFWGYYGQVPDSRTLEAPKTSSPERSFSPQSALEKAFEQFDSARFQARGARRRRSPRTSPDSPGTTGKFPTGFLLEYSGA